VKPLLKRLHVYVELIQAVIIFGRNENLVHNHFFAAHETQYFETNSQNLSHHSSSSSAEKGNEK
jgi:hypothetical protein